MATSDTYLNHLIINKLTEAQYNGATIDDNQLYFVTDGKISADDVDDRTSVNKFVTSGDKSTSKMPLFLARILKLLTANPFWGAGI